MNLNEIDFYGTDFSLLTGFFGKGTVAHLVDSKVEDVMNQSSNYNLNFCRYPSPVSKIRQYRSDQNLGRLQFKQALINIYYGASPTVLFSPPHLAWVLQTDHCLPWALCKYSCDKSILL